MTLTVNDLGQNVQSLNHFPRRCEKSKNSLFRVRKTVFSL
jgi:hypothetical protein